MLLGLDGTKRLLLLEEVLLLLEEVLLLLGKVLFVLLLLLLRPQNIMNHSESLRQ